MAQVITQQDLGNSGNQNQPGNPNQNPNQQQVGAGTASSNQTGANQSGTGPSQSSGGNGAQGAGAGGTTTQAPTVTSYNPNAQKGSGYTNIQKIIQANQGNQLGSTVAGGIQNQGQQLQQNLNTAQNQFNTGLQANQANTSANQQLVQNVLGNAANYVPGGQNANQASQFQSLISGQYQGPTSLQNSQQLQSQAQNVNQMNRALGSAAGRTGLLQQFVGNPQYSQGQQSLDALLLGQQNNSPQLAAARQATAQLNGQVNNAINSAQAQGAQQQQQAQMFGQNVQNQLGQQVSGLNTNLQQQAQQAQTAQNSSYQNAVQALQSGNINQNVANLLGITNGEQVAGNVLQNAGQYLTENPTQATAQNVASAQNYATLNALQQLAGNNLSQQTQNILGQYAGQSGQAGQFAAQPGIQGNEAGFNTANTGLINNYNSLVNPAQQAYNTAQANLNSLGVINGGIGGAINQAERAGLTQQLNQAQTAYQNALQSANAGTGGLDTINVNSGTPQGALTPSQMALSQAAGIS